MAVETVTILTVDDDTPRLRVGALSRAMIPEGGTATYPLWLNTQPASDVVVSVTSDNADVTTQPAELTFTPSDWDRNQMVTVTAASDGDTPTTPRPSPTRWWLRAARTSTTRSTTLRSR